MSICTRFGSEVRVISGIQDTGEVNIKFVDDGELMQTHIANLKADGGLPEIIKAINDANSKGS